MCRAAGDGGRRCLDQQALAALEPDDLRPQPAPDRPDVQWPDENPAQVLQRHPTGAGAQALAVLTHVRDVEAGMTGDVLAALPHGARADGLQWRVKAPGSLARKIDDRARSKQISVAAAAERCQDVVRYTAAVPTAGDFVAGARSLVAGLVDRGWQVREAEQSYADADGTVLRTPYKGLHLIMSKDGVVCEVQVHTEEALQVKAGSHVQYELERDLDAPREQRAAARQAMVGMWAVVSTPPGLTDLTDLGGVSVAVKHYPDPYRPRIDPE